jgi:hypothetical protein
MLLDAEPYLGLMRILRASSEAEVLAAFLCAELDSSRYGAKLRALLDEIGEDEVVLRSPNIADPRENEVREVLLERHRGWLSREGLFADFPERVDWSLAELDRDEVLSILYINWDWWLVVTNGTRRPLDAAARIRAGEISGTTAEEHEPIAARLRSAEPPPRLIVVAPPDHSGLVVLEGHVRLTAYALYPEFLPEELEVFLGTSDEMTLWSEFEGPHLP